MPITYPPLSLVIGGNTAGALATIRTGQILLAGGNNITLSQNGNSITISGGGGGAAGTHTFGISNLGNTSGTSGVISGSALQMILAGGNNVTLSQSINGSSATITISAVSQSAESNTFGMSNLGNTSGTSGVVSANQVRVLLAGGNNITLSQSLNGASATITISAFTQTVQTQGFGNTLGMSNLGNTSGTSGVVSGTGLQVLFAGGNNVTLSQSINGQSATITISAGAGGGAFSAGISTQGNTSGTTGLVGSQMLFVGGNNITLSQSVNGASATLTISGAAAGGGFTLSGWNPYNENPLAVAQLGQGSLFVEPMAFPQAVQFDHVVFPVNFSGATNSTGQKTITMRMGVYTKNASTLSLLHSQSMTLAWTHSGTANSSLFNGPRNLTMAWTSTISGGNYWIGVVSSTSSSSANASMSNFVVSRINSSHSGLFSVGSNATAQRELGLGRYTAATNGMPSSIGFTQLQGISSAFLRPQAFWFGSGSV